MNIKKIRTILPIGFGAIAVIVFIQTLIVQYTARQLRTASKQVEDIYQVELLLKGLEKTLVDAETGQRGFIFTNRENFLEPYNDAVSVIDDDIEELKTKVSDNQQQVDRLNEIENLVTAKLDELQETIELKREGRETELRELVLSGVGKQFLDDIRVIILEMVEVEEKLLEERQQQADQSYRIVVIVTWISLLASVIIAITIYILIKNIAIQPIEKIVSILTSSANEMATSIEQQQRSSSVQASSVNETSTTMDELGVSSQQSSSQAQQADIAAQEALKIAATGNESVTQSLNRMIDLKTQVEELSTQIVKLSEETNQIGMISQLVSDIANKTNMLALNASVEAVRAGESGKGFSVVAGEIRKLADQTKQSAAKINTLVNNVQNLLNNTVMATDEGTKKVNASMEITKNTTDSFQKIIDAVNNVVTNNRQITLNVKQQSGAIDQVVQTMNDLNQGAQETVNAVSQTQSTANQLNEVASQLKNII